MAGEIPAQVEDDCDAPIVSAGVRDRSGQRTFGPKALASNLARFPAREDAPGHGAQDVRYPGCLAAQATDKLHRDIILGECGYAANRRPGRFGRVLVRLHQEGKGGRRDQQGGEQHHDHRNQNRPIGYAEHRGTPSPRFRLMVRRTIAIPNITLIAGGRFPCPRSRSREWDCANQQIHLRLTATDGSDVSRVALRQWMTSASAAVRQRSRLARHRPPH